MTSALQISILAIFVVSWVAAVAVGYQVGRQHGVTSTGVWLTVVLHVIGLVILLRRYGHTVAAPRPETTFTRVAGPKPGLDEALSQTDSWIWR